MTQKNSIQDLRNKPRNIDEKVSKMNKKCRPENWDGKGRVESKKIWKLKRMNQVEIKGEKCISNRLDRTAENTPGMGAK